MRLQVFDAIGDVSVLGYKDTLSLLEDVADYYLNTGTVSESDFDFVPEELELVIDGDSVMFVEDGRLSWSHTRLLDKVQAMPVTKRYVAFVQDIVIYEADKRLSIIY